MNDSIEAKIAGHLQGYDEVLEALVELHKRLNGDRLLHVAQFERDFAIWAMSGRCLSLCRAMISMLRKGFCVESIPAARSLHEASHLLEAFTWSATIELIDPPTSRTVPATSASERQRRCIAVDRVLQVWLADETWVRPKKVRNAIEEAVHRFAKLSGAQSIKRHDCRKELSETIYDFLSRAGHNRKGGFQEQITLDRQRFAYGPHPDTNVQAAHVHWTGLLLDEVVIDFRNIVLLYPDNSFDRDLKKLLETTEAIRNTFPLR